MTCAFPGCHVKLNLNLKRWKDGREETTWVHGIIPEDVPFHDPVPVPTTDLKASYICDFCGDLNPEWLLGCPAYQDTYSGGSGIPDMVAKSDEGWAACAICKNLLDEGDVRGVTDRGVKSSELRGHLSRLNRAERRKVRPQVWKDMHEVHQKFMKMRTYKDWLLIDGIDKQRQVQALKSMFE